MRLQTLALAFFLIVQATPVSAQGPSIEFETRDFPDAREGYVSLDWNEVAGSIAAHVSYRVRDQNDRVVYRGGLPMAFVSGLPDGEYEFHVESVDANGDVLARSLVPAVVTVRHWSMWQAWLSFGVGMTVFIVLVVVIIHGSWNARRSAGVSSEADRLEATR